MTAPAFAVGNLVRVRDGWPLAPESDLQPATDYTVADVKGDYIRVDGIPWHYHVSLFQHARDVAQSGPAPDPMRPRVAPNACPSCWAPLPCRYHPSDGAT